MLPCGPLPLRKLSHYFFGTWLSRFSSYFWAISQFPYRLLLYSPLICEWLRFKPWLTSSFATLHLFLSCPSHSGSPPFLTVPYTLPPLSSPSSATHKFIHSCPLNTTHVIFHKFISSLNARCLFPVVYLIFPFNCLTDTWN